MQAAGDAPFRWDFVTPGLPDAAFADAPGFSPTPMEQRVMLLAHLRPRPDSLVWDVGGGTGALALEIARLMPSGQVHTLERDPEAIELLERNRLQFGIANLHLLHSARVEKSYWQSPLLQPAALEEALLAGLERSRDTIAPQVHLHRRFRPFVEDQLSGICAGRPCWLAHMDAPLALAEAPPVPAVVMIGPEGGFVPFEIQLAEAVSARRVCLGPRTLSVDTALVTVLAQASTDG